MPKISFAVFDITNVYRMHVYNVIDNNNIGYYQSTT
jgi:hypothetical protein